MSQGNWGGGPGGYGGGGPPPGGYGPPGGGGYGPPGAPPGGGGYGPPGAPPGGAPPGGYGPPGGAPPGGGYGPPPGGGGYGPPPGGGGYGAPPGGGGYGVPPDAPPGGGFGAPPGAMVPAGPGGQRVQFTGEGGTLLGTFIMYIIAPYFATMALVTTPMIMATAMVASSASAHHGRHASSGVEGVAMLFSILSIVGMLVGLVAIFVTPLLFLNKFIGFRMDNMVLDGQRCSYKGTVMELFKVHIVNQILTALTLGIYTPWALCRMATFMYENTEVNGQRGRLTFTGDGATLLGTYIIGAILTSCTFGIYGAWLANDIFAFFWQGTKLDGRPFGFKKDPGGFLGTYIITVILNMITCGIYYPWGICNIIRWETERVA